MNRTTSNISRRQFGRLAGAAGALSVLGLAGCASPTSTGGRVVVIGGGFGGASAAKAIRTLDPSIRVTLVEASSKFVTCPYSNLVLGGLRKIEDITFGYGALAQIGRAHV